MKRYTKVLEKNNKIKVLFIVPYPIEGPSNRYRVNQFVPKIVKYGIVGRVSNFYSKSFYKILYKKGHRTKKIFYFLIGTLKRLFDLISIVNYDVIFIHLGAYPIGPPTFEYIINLIGKPIVYDIDDAIYVPQMNNRFMNFLKWYHKVPQIIKMSSQVIACNDYLKKYAQKYNYNVTTIYTALDTERFTVKRLQNKGILTLGWIGSHSTTKYLESIISILEKIGEKYKFNLLIVGASKEIKLRGVNVINRKWELAREVDDFHDLDIGLYPLKRDNIVNAKTGFKTRQYMACGIPCVVSNIGANKDIVIDGKNGFLANNYKEWIEKLTKLITNYSLRKKIGLAGRKTVEKEYSLKILSPIMAEIIVKAYNN